MRALDLCRRCGSDHTVCGGKMCKPRSSPPQRTTRPAARNPARKRREWTRAYHSEKRVEWVKSQPCAYCRLRGLLPRNQHAGECHNAHTRNGGMGRKAGYETIVPLCARHHEDYDQRRAPFDTAAARLAVQFLAADTQCAWLSLCEEEG